jgi:hypothetical protein
MNEKRINLIIVIVVLIIAIAGISSYFLLRDGGVVTKDLSEIILITTDLSGEKCYHLFTEKPLIAPVWRECIEDALLSVWEEDYKHTNTICNVAKFFSIKDAERFYLSEFLWENERNVVAMIIPIGNESFTYSYPDTIFHENVVSIIFRKKNIVARISCEGSLEKVEEYARIVESRIP